MHEIVIIAGGTGTRLGGLEHNIAKTLLKINQDTILDILVNTMEECLRGKFKLVIVVGIFYDQLVEYVESKSWKNKEIIIEKSTMWQQGNAATLLAAREHIEGNSFILQMSDHLFSHETYLKCIEPSDIPIPYVCGQPMENEIPLYLDIDDATKVLVDSSYHVLEIGKEIRKWNMIDMGIFKLTTDAFDIISKLPKDQKFLSQYVSEWRKTRPFYVNPQPGAVWKDIDSPRDLEWARKMDSEGIWK
ncbi:MAG: sugar phosphate nucleotidyltransferase [Candidatus Thorarchaeota archaeon]